ncbi:glycosyltransferase family 2 protein [Algoriphagus halophytocola]|uniref:glycosyltransferase n=1 Tax=Algoriphagus halophytocola TaxID=2991499 RepID=UPI0022DE7FB1|nr:glycosyltransferase family 2 protein [Algoriphagus sp. TR-M9]WBL41303.1 glycosyltransferase family 2 protein [Algoriphagus sp. TR-M9]
MISVIIPHYKDNDRLILLLEQLNQQILKRDYWEVIVVNNDPYFPLVLPEKLSLVYILKILEESNPGSYAARNKGITAAQGNIIAFTDADCLPDTDWLKNAWDLFSQDFKKEIGILTGPVPLFFKDPNHLSPAEIYEKYTGGFTTELYAKEGKAITANWFSYKSVIEEFGGFNSELKSNGDSELSGRISRKYEVAYIPDLIVYHPARFHVSELVNKYQRLLGGTYTRRFKDDSIGFRRHLIQFLWARYRFALKRLFTLFPKESIPILKVCHAINMGAIQEYFSLIRGGETKR